MILLLHWRPLSVTLCKDFYVCVCLFSLLNGVSFSKNKSYWSLEMLLFWKLNRERMLKNSQNLGFRLFCFVFCFLNQMIYPIDLRERGTERKREINVREKQQPVACCMHPNWVSNPQPRYAPWLRIKPIPFGWRGLCSNHLSSQAGLRCSSLLYPLVGLNPNFLWFNLPGSELPAFCWY